jgi:hypothetical protein
LVIGKKKFGVKASERMGRDVEGLHRRDLFRVIKG